MLIKNLFCKNILDLIITAEKDSGNLFREADSYSFIIPAGTGTVIILVPSLSVETFFFNDLNILESDFYSDLNFVGLTNGFANELKYSTTPIYFSLPIEFKMTYFSSVPEAAQYIMANLSGTDMIVTLTIYLTNMKRSFFDDWYRKLFKTYYGYLNNIINLKR